MFVHWGLLGHRCAILNFGNVLGDVVEFVCAAEIFEDVEPVAPVRIQYFRVQFAVGGKADRPPVVHGERPHRAFFHIAGHGGLIDAEIDGHIGLHLLVWSLGYHNLTAQIGLKG